MSDAVSTLFLIYELWLLDFSKKKKTTMKTVGSFCFSLWYVAFILDEASQSFFASPLNMECGVVLKPSEK